MAVAFTPEQQKVIELRNRNLLVSAAAGAGKTAVLVERIVRMITDEEHPVDIDRLLVVTFTNAAAAEMRERVSLAISARLMANPENIHLQKQASLLHNAQITTIDSFCLFVIRNNFNDIGLDPGFRVADEGELKLLKQEVMGELLEEQYQEKSEAFIRCVEYFTGGKGDQLLEEYISKLYEFSMSSPWPEKWLGECAGDYKISDVSEMENTKWCRYLIDYFHRMAEGWVEAMDKAVSICGRPDGPYMYGQTVEREKEMLERLLDSATLQEFCEAAEGISFGRLPSKKDDAVSPAGRERVQQIRREIKSGFQEISTSCLLLSPEQALSRIQKAAGSVEELIRLTGCYKEKLDERKRKDNLIDFYDMEHFALRILLQEDQEGKIVPTEAAREYRQYFHEILIDEYQDSNLVQELLLKSISGEDEGCFNRFMVGDVKQSIYKFRLARPELFMEKYDCYSKDDSNSQRIDLHKNFRSRPQVLDSVNRVFYRIMRREMGGVEYDREAALYPGASYQEPALDPDYRTEYLIIGKDEASNLSTRQQEAAAIAGRIRELYRSFQVTDKESGRLRPVKYGDIVILLRTSSGWAEEFKTLLEKEGIPVHVASRTGYFQAVEVKVLLQLLHVIDNPLQDIPLYGTLKSFFGGFSEEELADIRSKDRSLPFYDLLTGYQGPLQERVEEFLKRLSRYRQKTVYTPIHRLLQEILWETGYLDYVTALPGGEQRRANVEMLLTRASAFENTSYHGLFHFLRYIKQLEKYEVDYGEADVLDENADVVRIMSIHKSKGLEFPVCFVAGLSKKFNMQDVSGRLIADVDMGIGVDYIDSTLRLQSHTLKKNAVALKMKIDALGEEMRILYVAMTRAREKLILTALVPDLVKWKEQLEQKREFEYPSGKEGGKVPFSELVNAGCYLDFLLPDPDEVRLMEPGALFYDDLRGAAAETVRKRRLFLETERLSSGQKTGRDNEIMTYLSKKFARTYPYQYLSELVIKTTVSELKKKGMQSLSNRSIEVGAEADSQAERAGRRLESAFTRPLFEEPEVVPYIPSFIKRQEGMSGTDRGSAYHRVMELLDLVSLKGLSGRAFRAELNRQLDEFVAREVLTAQWRDSVSVDKVETFLHTDLARRMARAEEAGRLWREQPFVLGLTADRLGDQFPDSEQILVQGIIDVFFEEDGQLVVADYKTDVIKTPGELVKRYQIQLDYYGEALERLTGKKVVQKIIYSFALGSEIMLY